MKNLKAFAAMIKEEETGAETGLFIKITNHENMMKAISALLENGFYVEVNFSMGIYYFNFKSSAVATQARAIINSVIDATKED